MEHDSRMMRGEKPFLFTNCKTGEGISRARRADPQRPAVRREAAGEAACVMRIAEGAPTLAPWAAAETLGLTAAELAAFQDEPPQMASGAVGKTGFPPPRLRSPRRPHDPRGPRSPRAVHGAARAVPGPRHARPGLALRDHHFGLRAAGRPARARGRAGAASARARDDAVGDQGPRHGRQLRGADAVDHARRRRLPRIPARAAHPAPARPLPERHADLDRPDRDAALRGDRPAGAQAPPPGRVLRRHAAVAVAVEAARPDGRRALHREAGDRAGAASGAADRRDGFVRRAGERRPADAEGPRGSRSTRGSRRT